MSMVNEGRVATNITRRLCASAILMGAKFRKIVLERIGDTHHAVAPEIDLDAELLAQVCYFLEEERPKLIRSVYRRYGFVLLIAAVIAFVFMTINANLFAGLVIYLIVGIPVQWFLRQQLKSYSDKELLGYFKLNVFNIETVKQAFYTYLPQKVVGGVANPNQNLVVYRGFTPFIGAGFNIGGWSFAINIEKGKEGAGGGSATPQPFEVTQLYQYIDQSLDKIQLDEMSKYEMLYVRGDEIRRDREILPDMFNRPLSEVPAAIVTKYINGVDPRVRYYKWIRVYDASESLTVSFFLRCAVRGSNLFCEINRFLMTPIIDDYKEIDRIKPDKGPSGILGWVFFGIAWCIGIAIEAIVSVFAAMDAYTSFVTEPISNFFERRRKRKEEERLCEDIADDLLYDFGAADSIRGGCSSDNYEHYFQKLDQKMYVEIIDRTILDVIVDFLDEHDINTSTLREQRTSILNNGVIIQGGDLKTNVLAVGEGASAQQTNTQGEGA